ncbi:hypothetical protein BUC_0671 [Burkholderia pseudomallei 576]|nr:hypothetical protein BUC_0671 [Burkholderia pseudomallei 576]
MAARGARVDKGQGSTPFVRRVAVTPGRRGIRRARAPVRPCRRVCANRGGVEGARRLRSTRAGGECPSAVPGEVVKPDAGRYHRRSVIATWRDVARWASARHGGGGGDIDIDGR